MSLLAIALVVGAPMVISMMDEDVSYNISSATPSDLSLIKINAKNGQTITHLSTATCVRDGAGNYLATYNNSTDSFDEISMLFDVKMSDLVDMGVSGFTATFGDTNISAMHVKMFGQSHTVRSAGVQDDEGNWTFPLTSLQQAQIKAMADDKETVSFQFQAVYPEAAILPATTSFYFGYVKSIEMVNPSIILGAIGLVLIICAIMATPWFPRYTKARRY